METIPSPLPRVPASQTWGCLWRTRTQMEGERRHLIAAAGIPLLFSTKKAASAYIDENYGHMCRRPDLRAEPHGWLLPQPVRVTVRLADPP